MVAEDPLDNMAKSKKKTEEKKRLTIRAFEAEQSAVDGGHPISNRMAGELDCGHGTPLLVVNTRDLIAFLKRVDTAATYTGATVGVGCRFPSETRPGWVEIHEGRADSSEHFMDQIRDEARELIKAWDQFVFEVSPDESGKNPK